MNERTSQQMSERIKSNEFQNYIKIKTRSQVLTTENASEEDPIGNLRCETTDTLSSIRIEITSSSGRGKYWEVEDLEDRGETLARGFGGGRRRRRRRRRRRGTTLEESLSFLCN